MSSRLSTRRVSRSSDSSAVASSSARSASLPLRRPGCAGGRPRPWPRRAGVRRSWLTAASSAVRSPVGLGERAARRRPARPAARCRSATAAWAANASSDPAVLGGQRRVRAGRATRSSSTGISVVRPARRASRQGCVADARPRPARRAGSSLARSGADRPASGSRSSRVTAVRPKVSRSWSSSAGSGRLAAQHAAGQRSTASRPRRVARAASRVRRAARSTTALTISATATNDDEREDVLPLGDGELVQRRGEVVVEQQRAGDGGEPAPARARRPGRRRRPRAGTAGCRWAGRARRAGRSARG